MTDPSSNLHRQRVLLVDDEQDILQALGDTLAAYLPEVEVHTAGSGPEALLILEHDPVDLVVTDYKMPVMNGLDFLAKARGIQPLVPRIMMTAYPDLHLAIQAINDEHILNFITKPLNREQIVQAIGSALAERRTAELRSRAFANSLETLRREMARRAAPPKA
jgi:DNA-binding NtrC family response regulator